MRIRTLTVLVAVVALLSAPTVVAPMTASAASASPFCFTLFSQGISRNALVGAITAGPDDNLWFTDASGIGRITPAGQVTQFSDGITPSATLASWITSGPDGNLWFTEESLDQVARITPAGVVTEFSKGIAVGANPSSITAGPDGNLWFTEGSAGRIGQITPTGHVTEFFQGISGEPTDIVAGPDGNLWFTDQPNDVMRITPTGQVTAFSLGGNKDSLPGSIARGPDGNIWFIAFGAIGRITPSGQVTEFTHGVSSFVTSGSANDTITAGPDGNLWFTESDDNHIGRITPGGQFTQFTLLGKGITSNTGIISGLAAGPDGNLWFTTGNANEDAVGRITLSGSCPSVAIAAHRARVSRKGRMHLTLSCGVGTGDCRGTLSLTAHTRRAGTVVLGQTVYTISAGQHARIALRLSAKGRRRLRRALHHRLRVSAATANGSKSITLTLA